MDNLETHEKYMKMALEEAKKGIGFTSPNPLVGAVIIKNGEIIGIGAHLKFGENHAEVNAIENASKSVEGATMYVTLEPCDHQGKTPPCSLRIIKEKISKIYIASVDTSSKVNGRGIKRLKDAGIEVVCGICEKEALELNEPFFHFSKTGLPFILLKSAVTLDGFISAENGASKWISNEQSRTYVHYLRSVYDGVLIGKNTALIDNPKLNIRLVKGRNPYRIVVDSKLSLPLDLNLFTDDLASKTIVITTTQKDILKEKSLIKRGIKIITTQTIDGHVNLKEMFFELAKIGLHSIMVEGGATLVENLIKLELIQRFNLFIAPILLGKGKKIISDTGKNVNKISDAIHLDNVKFEIFGNNILINGLFQY